MQTQITIIFPFRDRDATRVRLSLQSLELQSSKDFEVIFVDYGSQDSYANSVKNTVNNFDFVSYMYVGHPGLLWNKSKALNYGIKTAKSQYIVTADVDVLFGETFIEKALDLAKSNTFSLFKIGYLSQKITEQQQSELNLKAIETKFIGDTFGIGLYPKLALEKVGGVDEFFHFYGSEDQDLNYRISLTETSLSNCDDVLLYHQWHPRYPQKSNKQLTQMPRLSNALRINQRHFIRHQEESLLHPNSKNWGFVYKKNDKLLLEESRHKIELSNVSSHITHFFREEIKQYNDSVVTVVVTEAPYYKSLKHLIKKLLGKQTQPYMSMKEVNDLILKEIIFTYRDYNYSYLVSENLNQIFFTIQLNINSYDGL
ncbi:glycosyltransferase [Winogradskyella litoriviva]|uniref:Glycosyltransferase n=1 Tax=Winogradskyella litoriviva TaxID=1220182 RepID=A0ABX2E2V2_9FLAO|nr:glycosyltransferase [Winogradskyella litoriviva]NRD22828.1 glycosyltransferase [Winogradskyella litoriviva]